ncbi:hypothetical protein F5050DRAFT_431757 [Lentinula boryana]|uniref:Pal1-domain-containing protein n=1 Tax=Lentinula boryana TaxID=40481 RepID=A0ABQ8Q821_9AGAR|nr:hypothetical protein F5050DRAFT_431757 [Lentinula boryana]
MSSDSNQDPPSNANTSRPPPRYQTKSDDSRAATSSNSNQNPPSNSNTSPQYQTKFDDPQLPRRPATTAAAVPVTTMITGTFFAGAHHFDIQGGEFTHTAGNLYRTIRNDHSTRSNFDNTYGHDYSGSGNRANNYHDAYSTSLIHRVFRVGPLTAIIDDRRKFRSQRYDASFVDTQFVSRGRGRGRGRGQHFNPRQNDAHGPNFIHEPIPQQAHQEAVLERDFDLYAFDRVYNVHAEPEEISAYPFPNAPPVNAAARSMQADVMMDDADIADGRGREPCDDSRTETLRSDTALTSVE